MQMVPNTSRPMAFPHSPSTAKYMAMGTHTTVVPTIGTIEHRPVRKAARKAFGTPKNMYPTHEMSPCSRAIIGIPMAFDFTITFIFSIVSFLFMFFMGMRDER